MRILALKLADLGDLLLTEPALRSLRQGYPDAQIDVLTTPQAVPLLDLIDLNLSHIAFDKAAFDLPGPAIAGSALAAGRLAARLRSARYDRVVLFHHLTTSWGAAKFRALVAATGAPVVAGLDNGRGTFLTQRVIDRGFGAQREAEYMLKVAVAAGGMLVDPQPRIERVQSRTSVPLPVRFVALAPVAGPYSRAREWPLERFVELAQRLMQAGHAVVVVGGADSCDAGATIRSHVDGDCLIDLTGKTTIPQLAGLLARARMLIGNDSFPAHLAAALEVPVVTIFGPSNQRAWAPNGLIVSAGLPCSPCLYTGYELGRRQGCPRRTCLTSIGTDEVYSAAMELLGA